MFLVHSGRDFKAEFGEVGVVEMVKLVLFRGILELGIDSGFLYHN